MDEKVEEGRGEGGDSGGNDVSEDEGGYKVLDIYI